MRPKIFIISLIIIFQFTVNTVIGAAWVIPRNSQVFPAGVSINGIDIGGLTESQAASFLKQKIPLIVIDMELVINDGQKNYIIKTRDYSFAYDYDKTVEQVFETITPGNSSSRIINSVKLQAKGMDFPLLISCDEKKLLNDLDTINEQVMIAAQDASLEYRAGKYIVKEEVPGQELQIDSILDSILTAVRSGDTGPLTLPKKEITPRVSKQNLENIDCELAVFSTSIAYSTSNRSHNIVLASKILDNTVIMPSETFSFNKHVGERSQEKGYANAPIIINNVLKEDIGGGVCQVASTFYNTALLAGLGIIEHSNHSTPVKYVPPGKDATVYYDQVDLKIKNTLQNPILIRSYIEKNNLVVKLLGTSSDKKPQS